MFKKLFAKKTKAEILLKEYEKLMKTSYELSKVNRAKSDLKMAEAEAILDEIKKIKEKL